MKLSTWLALTAGVILSAGCFATAGVAKPARDPVPPPPGPDLKQRDLDQQRQEAQLDREAREAELALQAKEDELDFRNEMRKLDLEKKKQELARPDAARGCPAREGCRGWAHRPRPAFLAAMAAGCLLMHILLTVWVYRDIRARNAGSGLWVAVTLLSGFPGALLYALVRIGDRPAER